MERIDVEVGATNTGNIALGITDDSVVVKLIGEMLARRVVAVRPELNVTAEMGFGYPDVEKALGMTTENLVPVLESLADRGILKRELYDRLLFCPQCRSMNLRPSMRCPKCRSADIVHGTVIKHLACKYAGLEDDFVEGDRYICPGCRGKLRMIDIDYESLGVQRKCNDCEDIFGVPLMEWHCLSCSSRTAEDEVGEIDVYSYVLDESKRRLLEFELQPMARFITHLQAQGYLVTRDTRIKGRSGAEHMVDVLATRDDGVVTHEIAVVVAVVDDEIGLDRILDFDVKAYDAGFVNKMLIVTTGLGEEARAFARLQRIHVLQAEELETLPAVDTAPLPGVADEPFRFLSKSQFKQYLEGQGYEVQENAEVEGRSGATHNIDILATRDEGIIVHRIAVGIAVGEKPLALDRVFDFDDKAYDAGILNKVFIAVPGLTKEAKEFARRQRIRVFEVKRLEPAPKQPAEG